MHGVVSRTLRARQEEEGGAVAVIFAVSIVVLMIGVGMTLDFGLIKVDRQVDKSAADAATLAGLHGLVTGGSGTAYPYAGVCTAVRYLEANDPRFADLNEATGWTNGAGTAVASGCSSTALQHAACVPGNSATWAVYTWTGSWQGASISVTVQSGYQLSTSGWAEDGLQASSTDTDDSAQGCDQLAVIVHQSRRPGFGSLASSSDLSTSIRSVGRVTLQPGSFAPALLLLKQTGCGVVTTGTSAGGSKIAVLGAVASNGLTQPGTIHSDSDGTGCGSNQNIFTGNAQDGIVAYAAPISATNAAADPAKPGQVTSYASFLGQSGSLVRDSSYNVCGSKVVPPAAPACPGVDVLPKDRVTRKPIDTRYLAAVQGMRNAANTMFASNFSTWTNNFNTCSPTSAQATQMAALTASDTVYINCTANGGFKGTGSGTTTIGAGTVVFAGSINPSATVSLPNATRVYVVGASGDAITLGNGGTLSIHTAGNLSAGLCSSSATGTVDKAVLVVENGDIKQTGGTLQMCYTSVLMMGGRPDACLPTAPSSAAPNPTTPCGGSTGTGQLTQTGGNVDWTAPNQYDATLQLDGTPVAAAAAAWADPTGPEDLALWSESGGGSNSPKYQMTGGGSVHLVGVMMTPNAEPFNLSGQFIQRLVNAQYVASSVNLSSNNTQLTMQVDPNAAVTEPQLGLVGLVR